MSRKRPVELTHGHGMYDGGHAMHVLATSSWERTLATGTRRSIGLGWGPPKPDTCLVDRDMIRDSLCTFGR
ncbi:hypothetical protein AMTR_s00021p00252540 [Amborella trichopoda]|uniref:Uncharacterized protein n=1 Tax=Amborella trichopoda TaxID=13333 RepID=W1Q0P9_AMBTC|nr:hypothetical protein AMTR_s00021p00252540 [Amborella trichopoda]